MNSTFIHIQGSLHRDISLLPLSSQELGSLLATLWGGHGWAVPWTVRWLGEEGSLPSVLAAGKNAQEILCAHGGKTELLRILGLEVSLTRMSPLRIGTRLKKSQPG